MKKENKYNILKSRMHLKLLEINKDCWMQQKYFDTKYKNLKYLFI